MKIEVETLSASQVLQELELDETKSAAKDRIDPILSTYLVALRKEYLALTEQPQTTIVFCVNQQLKENLFKYIWTGDVFRSPKTNLQRIYHDIDRKLFCESSTQTDLEDYLKYHPTEIFSAKFIQVVLSMALVEPQLVKKNLIFIRDLLKDERLKGLDSSTLHAYHFIWNTLKATFDVLTGRPDEDCLIAGPTDYEDLDTESKGIVAGLSALYMHVFRARGQDRIQRLVKAVKSAPASWEWTLYLAEAFRMRRRDNSFRSKKPTQEELELIELTLTLDKENPFTRWNLIECVVDSVREFNGRFTCGEVKLFDTDQAMRFLRDECSKLCVELPRNVTFRSIVSDYFARYVPYVYFDKDFSLDHLQVAYELNPENPDTTHRMSILWRMNFRDPDQSLNWMTKTLELDQSFCKAQLDYLKLVLGKPEKFKNVGEEKEKVILDKKFCGEWRVWELAEFKFYLGLAYFADGRKDDTLRLWREVMSVNETYFRFNEVDQDCGNFGWNTKYISTDKIREWINDTWNTIKVLKPGQYDPEEKSMAERMFTLMLGIRDPQVLESTGNVYFPNFKHKFVA